MRPKSGDRFEADDLLWVPTHAALCESMKLLAWSYTRQFQKKEAWGGGEQEEPPFCHGVHGGRRSHAGADLVIVDPRHVSWTVFLEFQFFNRKFRPRGMILTVRLIQRTRNIERYDYLSRLEGSKSASFSFSLSFSSLSFLLYSYRLRCCFFLPSLFYVVYSLLLYASQHRERACLFIFPKFKCHRFVYFVLSSSWPV